MACSYMFLACPYIVYRGLRTYTIDDGKDQGEACMNIINIDEFKDKVYGCWTGKNIGGTLGAPFEGKKELLDIDFYSQDLKGASIPNDDLDLQLVWFQAIKEYGIHNLNSRILAEFWHSVVNGPWNEYGVGRTNIRMGLLPPLSGSCNNDRWKWSNGAWIRSEIWACMAPGDPDRAIQYAYMDACVDHSGEGIYAEMFTASLESAAFLISDINDLIKIGLCKIPADSRVARSVKIAIDHYKAGKDWKSARNAILKDSVDLGWFQAPANIGFTVVGLLYGEGDFGKTICTAVNCGDDTDCTGATAGAIMGIIAGRKALPEKWTSPIGEAISTVCITPFMAPPRSLTVLTEQVVAETLDQGKPWRMRSAAQGSLAVTIDSRKTQHDDALLEKLSGTGAAAGIWKLSPYALTFDLSNIQVVVDYIDGPDIASGVEKKMRIQIDRSHKLWVYEKMITVNWRLPDGWQMTPDRNLTFYICGNKAAECDLSITPGIIDDGFSYIELEVSENGRLTPSILTIPFQKRSSVCFSQNAESPIQL